MPQDTRLRVRNGDECRSPPQSPIPQPVAASKRCRVLTASYGGKKTLLVLARAGGELHYTALTVLDGFEHSMLDNYRARRTRRGGEPRRVRVSRMPRSPRPGSCARGRRKRRVLEGAGAG